jgi:uncharacterized protein
MTRLAGLLGLLIALCLGTVALAQAPAAPGPKFPPLTGRVVDDAHVLSPQVQADLTQKLADLEQRTSRQLVVVTLPSLQGYDIADYGYQLLRSWRIGQKGLDNGAIFIVAPSEHKVRVEVGYGLEPILTDGLSSVILQEQVLPKFRAGDVPGGVVAGTDALIGQLGTDTSTAEAKAAAAEQPHYAYHHHRSGIGAIVPLILIFFVVSALFRGRGGGMGGLLPMLFLGSALRGLGGRDDDFGGGGGWGGGGGGFSGGGGSGGGGGASGSW